MGEELLLSLVAPDPPAVRHAVAVLVEWLLADRRFPFLVGSAGNDKPSAGADARDHMTLAKVVDGFLAHVEPVRYFGDGDRRVGLGFAGHGGLRSILRGIGSR